MPAVLTHEEWAKVVAWVIAIRQLARQHKCSHRISFGHAIKVTQRRLVSESLVRMIDISMSHAYAAGIPEEELRAIRALLFG